MLSKTLIRETFIATLGTEPQVVSITLDRLLQEGHSINEVVVIHTESSGVGEALSVLQKEFVTETYSRIRLRTVPVESQHGPIVDFNTEEDLRALLGTLYREVCRVRRDGYIVHLSISGGRKVMAIMAMVVAQLLFGPNDRVWHLFTEGWEPGAKRRLHPGVGERIWLIPIPVLRWTEAGTLMRTVAELDDPAEVVAWYERLSRQASERHKEQFIRHWLSPAERDAVRLACRGFDNATIAKILHKSEQTVANQLHTVYEKLREWLEYPDTSVDRSVLIAQFAPYFAQMNEIGKEGGHVPH